MTEKFRVVEYRGHLFAQQRTELFRALFLRLGRRFVRQGCLELLELATSELVVDPSSPFFLKRFHKHPSTNAATSCERRRAATSRCQLSSPGLRQSRDTAYLQFLSSK